MSKSRSSSSRRWLKEHFSDPFVKQAMSDGYPSRAAYKLLALNKKNKFIRPGMRVADLGAAPGGWTVVARDLVGEKGHIYALDRLSMTAPVGVTFLQGDFTEESVLSQLTDLLNGQSLDLVLSDMAPNLAGNKSIDQPRMMYLAELALDFAVNALSPGGHFLCKIFQGEGSEAFAQVVKKHFKTMKWQKPPASRARSAEIYVLGLDKY